MRQKLHLQDLSVLFICPSFKWGTNEKRCFKDLVFFRDIGGRAILACPVNSFLFLEAKSQNIETLPIQDEDFNGVFRTARSIMRLSHWLNIFKINLVHLYSADSIPAVSTALQRKSEIPLILTYTHSTQKKMLTPFYLWALKRVDMVLSFTSMIEEAAKINLPLSLRKFRLVGLGVTESSSLIRPMEREKASLASYVPKYWRTADEVMTLLNSFLMIKAEMLSKSFSLVLFTDGKWSDFSFYKSLLDFLELNDQDHRITLEEGDLFTRNRSYHVFIGIEGDEAISDIEVTALLKGIAVVLPRTPSRQDLLANCQHIGEAYKKGDARELKNKCLKLLSNYSEYADQVDLHRELLLQKHGSEVYEEELYEIYKRLFDQRQRLTRHVTHANS